MQIPMWGVCTYNGEHLRRHHHKTLGDHRCNHIFTERFCGVLETPVARPFEFPSHIVGILVGDFPFTYLS
jgi:hypothetical protein